MGINLGPTSSANTELNQDALTASENAIVLKQRNHGTAVLPGGVNVSGHAVLTVATDQGAVAAGMNLANQAISLVENSATVAAGSTADALSNQNDLLQKFLDNQANAQSGGQNDANKSFIKLAAVAVLGLVVIVIAIASIFKPHKA